MKKYVIELRGVEFHNKGAELMLYAILEKVRKELPDAKFVMEKRDIAPVKKQREVGIFTKLHSKKFGITTEFIPQQLTEKLGYIPEKEINVVLDGSGFAFGDFWGPEKAGMRMANHIEKWTHQGKKVIMLSQAFGSFENKALQEKMSVILNKADLVFARDNYSYSYLKSIPANHSNLFLRPDFTNLIKGKVPDYFDTEKYEIAIIPNNKLLESKVFSSREKYLDFLNNVTTLITESGKKPFFLIHEGVKDFKLAEEVNTVYNKQVPILRVDDPLHVKGIISKSQGVVTSRFHGLVSALSQAIPCLCVGWSHKYLALMEDYAFAEGLIKDEDLGGDALKGKLDLILNAKSSEDIHERLKLASIRQKELSQDMWNMVFDVIKN